MKKRKFLPLLAVLLAFVLVLTGCESGADAGSDDEWDGSVAMVFSGLVTDEAFNQFTYEGMQDAVKEKGIKKFAYKEDVSQDEQVEVIRQFAQQGYKIIIGQGGQFGEALSIVAQEYPDTQFLFSVGVDTYDLSNMSAATVSYHESGFIGGVLSALTTKTNKVAMITGEWYGPHRQMEQGFYKGVEYVNPDIEVTAITTGDWADTVKAREASLGLIAQGYDVLMPCLDAAGAGVAAAAQDSTDVWVVGTVADYAKDYNAEDVVAGSAEFEWVKLGYLESLGEYCDGESHVIGLKEGGLKPIVNIKLDAEKQAKFDEAMEQLKNGEINFED